MGMITHTVIFWTNKPHGDNQQQLLKGACELLAKIPGVTAFHAGLPVPSPRGVVDDSFAVAITMQFEDQTSADEYQAHDLHQQFVVEYVKPYATRFVVYDWS